MRTRLKAPTGLRSRAHERMSCKGGGVSAGPGLVNLHLNVTMMPCSLPRGQPAGVPVGSIIRLRLVPFGPLAKIKNVLPPVATQIWKNASIRFEVKTCTDAARLTLTGLAIST